ncbi:type VII secretion integral membrane protein EccD [Micromonospora sp. NPDC049559]|uniref:type VII secretion integral membrane protein EccD n=1 Tax=Micromonospora sp. NPDC049559 TaxID=3155923 RepID=UPI00343546EE
MAAPNSTGLSRVTLVAPRTRVDLALPADVPLADMLPTLLRYAGDGLADAPDAREGWTLSRLGGVVLDSSRTPAQLEVRDGELLYLRPRGGDAPELVFDDVVDAVATATQERPGRWQPATTRAFGLALGLVALLGGAALVLFAGPPQLLGGIVGLGLAVALLVTAVVFARALGDSRTGVAFALVACVYAAVGGLLVFGGDRTLGQLSAPHALVAATAVLLVTVLAAVGVADTVALFLGAGICAFALVVGAAISMLTGTGPAGAAAVVVTAAFAGVPALPLLAYRLARLPVPSVPSGPEDLKRDTETVEGARVLALSDRADGFLAGMLGALAVLGAGAGVLVATGGYPGLAMAGVLGLLLMARARWFLNRLQRLPLLIAGAVALGAAAVAAFLLTGPALRLSAILGALVVLAVISIGYALVGPGRKAAPFWGRMLDLFEVVLILALVPLAFWVSGLYAWIRTIRG